LLFLEDLASVHGPAAFRSFERWMTGQGCAGMAPGATDHR
jgi:hypothetical protein